jgi:hypothetical protein
MSTNTFLAICLQKSLGTIISIEKYFHGLVWGVAAVFAWVPFSLNGPATVSGHSGVEVYGDATLYCWIHNEWAQYRLVRIANHFLVIFPHLVSLIVQFKRIFNQLMIDYLQL